jgi:glycosyltransferase involved in cell wall biosynthesis
MIRALQFGASVRQLYEGAPRYDDVIRSCEQRGFLVSGIYPNNGGLFPLLVEFDCFMIHEGIAELAGAPPGEAEPAAGIGQGLGAAGDTELPTPWRAPSARHTRRPVQILTFTTLYPSEVRPQHGIFVETRLRKLVESGRVEARVVAPCPWFPFTSPRFGAYAVMARVPHEEIWHELAIEHPRYPLMPKIGMSTAPFALFAAVLPRLRQQIAAGRDFELIDAHYFYPDGVAAVLLGRRLGRPVVITARGDDLGLIANYAAPRQLIRWAAERAAGLITVSSGLQRQLVSLGVAPERVRMLRNGVDLELFRSAERDLARQRLGLGRPTLLAVANLVPKKRHHLMIEALAALPGIDLLIVGEGSERGRIQALARQLGVADRVRLLGAMPQHRLPDIYSAADLLLLPSAREGWPNVLLESMACGTPVVVSDIDGMADIVAAPEAGRVVPRITPDSLAAAIRDFLAALPNRAATRTYAEQFDWRSTTDSQIALFEEIREMAQQRAAPRVLAA